MFYQIDITSSKIVHWQTFLVPKKSRWKLLMCDLDLRIRVTVCGDIVDGDIRFIHHSTAGAGNGSFAF